MEGLGILGTLILGGKMISDKKKDTKITKEVKIPKNKIPTTKNIYESDNLSRINKYHHKLAEKRYQQSKNPEKTGIIPRMYNRMNEPFSEENKSNDSEYSEESNIENESKMSSTPMDHMTLFNKTEELRNNKEFQENIHQGKAKPIEGFMSQFEDMAFDNPSHPVAENSVEHKIGGNANMKRIEIQRNMDIDGGFSSFNADNDMAYGIINDKNEFVHNNMVPFFSSNKKGYGINPLGDMARNDSNQRKLDLFTGSLNNLDYRPKTERRPLFSPIVGLSNIYGMPNFNDYFETRYTPGRERRNEFPVQQIRVTPGLNIGYGQDMRGLHDTYRVLPKTVDDLRPASKPKISYGSVVIPGMKGHKRATLPDVRKRRPETFKENDPRDMVKSLGYIRAHTSYGNYDPKQTNRLMYNIAWSGPAANQKDKQLPWDRLPQHRKSFHQTFEARQQGAPVFIGAQKATANRNSYDAKMTNRQTTEANNWIGGANRSFVKAGHAFDINNNIPESTMRDTTINNNWVGGANRSFVKAGHAFDMNNNVPDATQRDTTSNNNWIGGINGFMKAGHAFDMNNNIPDATQRDTTSINNWTGGINGFMKAGHAFDMNNNIPDATQRDTTSNNNWTGGINGFMKAGHAFDMKNNIPDATQRDTTSINNWTGGINGFMKAGHAFDMKNNIPDATQRDTTSINNWTGGINGFMKAGHAFDMKTNIPDATHRDTYSNNNYINPVKSANSKGGYDVEQQGTSIDATHRDTYSKNNYVNPMKSANSKGGYDVEQQGTSIDATHRDTYSKNNYINPMKSANSKGGYDVEQQGTSIDATHRDTYSKNNYINPMKSANSKGGYDIAQQKTNMSITHRQTYSKNNYVAPAGFHEKQRSRGDISNMLVNEIKEKSLTGRAPTTSNYNRGPVMDFSTVQLCEPIQINRDLYPSMNRMNTLDCLPIAHTRIGNRNLPNSEWRIDEHISENLQGNPFINNTQHKSITF
jgi:hypothetical protein